MTPFLPVGFQKMRTAFAASVLLLVLSVLLVASATYAWLSDSVVNRGNVIRCADAPFSPTEVLDAGDSESVAGLNGTPGNVEDVNADGGGGASDDDPDFSPVVSEGGESESQTSGSEAAKPSCSPDENFDPTPKRDAGAG